MRVCSICGGHYGLCGIIQLKRKQTLIKTHFHESLPHLLDLINRFLFFKCLNMLIYTFVPL